MNPAYNTYEYFMAEHQTRISAWHRMAVAWRDGMGQDWEAL